MLIVGLLIGAGITYLAAPSLGLGGATTTTVSGGVTTVTGGATTVTSRVTSTVTAPGGGGLCNGQTITIGALFDLSGGLSNLGRRSSVSGQLAIDDVNAALAAAGCDLTFALSVSDYALNNDQALAAVQAFAAQGVSVVLGPFNSGSAQFILSYANENHIVIVSPSSTAATLAIADDYLFRTAPNDLAQGPAIARMLRDRGVEAVIVVNRIDAYGDGLADSVIARFEQLGGTLVDQIRYDTTTTDFTAVLTQMSSDWQTASGTFGADNVAIEVISFEEIGSMLVQAHTSFPDLLDTPLPWFGSDGQAQNGVIVNASTSGPYMAQIRLPSTLFAVTNNTRTLAFFERYTAALPGNACEFYCLEIYNDVWLGALSILTAGQNDGAAVHAVFPTVAAGFFGLTGWEGLQASGDRDPFPGEYQIWMVVQAGQAYTWILAGVYHGSSDTVTWTTEP